MFIFSSSPPGIAVQRTASLRSPMTRWSIETRRCRMDCRIFCIKTALRAFCPAMTKLEKRFAASPQIGRGEFSNGRLLQREDQAVEIRADNRADGTAG